MKKRLVLILPTLLLLPTLMWGSVHNVWCNCPFTLNVTCTCSNTGTGDYKVTGAVTFGVVKDTTTDLTVHCTHHLKNLPILYRVSLGKNDVAVRCGHVHHNQWSCHNWAPVHHNVTVDRIICHGGYPTG